MSTTLLLLLFLTGHVFAKQPPDVDCIVIHLKTVHCSWKTPVVNYTFYSWFSSHPVRECSDYLSENQMITGCIQPYGDKSNKFFTFYTKLVHNNDSFLMEHDLKTKVKLDPPTNLTVQNGSDTNLFFYWNQTSAGCVESEVRYRTNNKKWQSSKVSRGRQSFCINLASSSSRYELQVRSILEKTCKESIFWSDWSEPVVWGSNNGTDHDQLAGSVSVWAPVPYVLGSAALIFVVMMWLHHDRWRIIFIPVVPKPTLIPQDIEGWLQISKGFKEGFKANYNERACPVREYCHISESDSETSDNSTFSFTTDQTDCSMSISGNNSEQMSPCSSSTSTVVTSSEEQQVFV